MKVQFTPGKERRVRRWEHEALIDAMQARLNREPEKMRLLRQTAEHPFGTTRRGWGPTLSDQDAEASEYQDESACTGLQPQARDKDPAFAR
jgi:hypothetical protein